MILEMFSVFDQGVRTYLPPFFCRHRGEALRVFTEAVNAKDHQFNKYPTDYVLFHLGQWNDQTGEFAAGVGQKVVGGHEVLADAVSGPELVDLSRPLELKREKFHG